MDGDVHRPVGANVHHAHAASVERGAQLVEPPRPGVPAARPRAVDTTPSMPLAPRFATTRTPSRGGAYHSRSRTGIDDETMSTASLGSRSSRARATPGSVGAVCASSTDAMVAWA